MLFIIAMDVLHRLFLKATRDGVLWRMELAEIKFKCILYADDVILFIQPTVQEAMAVKEILNVFGTASGLNTNLAKCSVMPIFGAKDSLEEIVSILGYQVQAFPIKYLGLPLSTRSIPKALSVCGRGCGSEDAAMPRGSNGEEWTSGLDQVRAPFCSNLHNDRGKSSAMGTEGDQQPL
jgi:hypothetical protein